MKTWMMLGLLAALTACSNDAAEEKTAYGTLSRTLQMVDENGKHYGTVELNPVGGGKVVDNDGRLIGRITPPKE